MTYNLNSITFYYIKLVTMHSFKIILISLAPVLAIPAMSPRDIDSDEPFDFG